MLETPKDFSVSRDNKRKITVMLSLHYSDLATIGPYLCLYFS